MKEKVYFFGKVNCIISSISVSNQCFDVLNFIVDITEENVLFNLTIRT